MLKQILQGMVIGLSNVIPGVSGGTMMVAMGLYDKLIHAITHIRKEFKESLKLLLPIVLGMGIAVVAFAKLVEFLLTAYPIQTNFAFCGLIAGSLPFILKKVKGHSVTVDKLIPFLVFFVLVIGMALLGESGGKTADVTFGFVNVLKLFGTGIVAAATMVVPGVSGSMMLMLLGYYDVIIKTVNVCVESLVSFDMAKLLEAVGVLAPFGIGVLVGIGVIAKLIEYIFAKAEIHAYYAIIGLILASPIAILLKTDWSNGSLAAVLVGLVTFAAGAFVAGKLGGE